MWLSQVRRERSASSSANSSLYPSRLGSKMQSGSLQEDAQLNYEKIKEQLIKKEAQWRSQQGVQDLKTGGDYTDAQRISAMKRACNDAGPEKPISLPPPMQNRVSSQPSSFRDATATHIPGVIGSPSVSPGPSLVVQAASPQGSPTVLYRQTASPLGSPRQAIPSSSTKAVAGAGPGLSPDGSSFAWSAVSTAAVTALGTSFSSPMPSRSPSPIGSPRAAFPTHSNQAYSSPVSSPPQPSPLSQPPQLPQPQQPHPCSQGGFPRQTSPFDGGYARQTSPFDGGYARQASPFEGSFAWQTSPVECGMPRQSSPSQGGLARQNSPHQASAASLPSMPFSHVAAAAGGLGTRSASACTLPLAHVGATEGATSIYPARPLVSGFSWSNVQVSVVPPGAQERRAVSPEPAATVSVMPPGGQERRGVTPGEAKPAAMVARRSIHVRPLNLAAVGHKSKTSIGIQTEYQASIGIQTDSGEPNSTPSPKAGTTEPQQPRRNTVSVQAGPAIYPASRSRDSSPLRARPLSSENEIKDETAVLASPLVIIGQGATMTTKVVADDLIIPIHDAGQQAIGHQKLAGAVDTKAPDTNPVTSDGHEQQCLSSSVATLPPQQLASHRSPRDPGSARTVATTISSVPVPLYTSMEQLTESSKALPESHPRGSAQTFHHHAPTLTVPSAAMSPEPTSRATFPMTGTTRARSSAASPAAAHRAEGDPRLVDWSASADARLPSPEAISRALLVPKLYSASAKHLHEPVRQMQDTSSIASVSTRTPPVASTMPPSTHASPSSSQAARFPRSDLASTLLRARSPDRHMSPNTHQVTYMPSESPKPSPELVSRPAILPPNSAPLQFCPSPVRISPESSPRRTRRNSPTQINFRVLPPSATQTIITQQAIFTPQTKSTVKSPPDIWRAAKAAHGEPQVTTKRTATSPEKSPFSAEVTNVPTASPELQPRATRPMHSPPAARVVLSSAHTPVLQRVQEPSRLHYRSPVRANGVVRSSGNGLAADEK